FFFFSSSRRHTRSKRYWSSEVCSSDLVEKRAEPRDDHHDVARLKRLELPQQESRDQRHGDGGREAERGHGSAGHAGLCLSGGKEIGRASCRAGEQEVVRAEREDGEKED